MAQYFVGLGGLAAFPLSAPRVVLYRSKRVNSRVCRLAAWVAVSCIVASASIPSSLAQGLIVDQGHALADIVIADAPSRTANLAAVELQNYIEKISGGRRRSSLSRARTNRFKCMLVPARTRIGWTSPTTA